MLRWLAMVDNRYRFEQLVMVDSPDRFLYYMCVIGKCALKAEKYQNIYYENGRL